MDAKNAGNHAAHEEGDTDGARNFAPPLVLTADQMAQVHQAEYLMDVGELERPPSEIERLQADAAYIIDLLRKEGVRVNEGESAAEAVGNYITIVRLRLRGAQEANHD